MANAVEFTQALIESTNRKAQFSKKLREGNERLTPAQMKFHKMEKCGGKKKIEDGEEKTKDLKEASDIEDKVDDAIDDAVKDKVEDIIENADGDTETTEVEVGADDVEESIDDFVFFCNKCHKHFIATPEVALDAVKCPICEDDTMLINMGKASDYVDDKQNEDAVEEIKDEEPEALEPEVEEEEEGKMEFHAESLGECLEAIARKHINEKAVVKVLSAKQSEDNMILECVCLPDKKDFTVTLINAKSLTEGKGVIEGTSDLFKNCKVRVGYMKEGNAVTIDRMGYGFLNESADAKLRKVVGVVGK